MHHTTDYRIKSKAKVDGKAVERIFTGFSSTEGFSEELARDLAADEFQKIYPGSDIEVQTAELVPVT